MNRKYIPPKKNTNNLVTLALTLVVLALAAVVFIMILVLKDGRPADESKSTSIVSAQSAPQTDASSQAVSQDTSEPQTSETSSQTETSNYEDYIGVKYKIDISQWEQYIDPEDDTPYLILVNKTNPLDRNYVPADMIDVVHTRKDGRATQKMVRTAEKALEAFLLEAKEYGVTNVSVTSAYRSYDYQEQLFNSYVNQHLSKFSSREECEKYVETFSARPGTSEHQTGLTCDMHNLPSAEVTFANTPEAKWLAENAHRFGFILRYPADKTEITGYSYEPWHFRFVGRKAATIMYENGWCLEEYYAHIIENKN
ncbi:MAG TPA: M15 family metallopeptidase [Bacillota bacterium]|nr:M15 family metallopeptidase [Bacillota bacterium]HOK68875.1 M15 family metallopeptidase [Bacillota bacterium]HPP85672.1 M15 family metallopeptidase [Bacillota bacterium]